MYSTIETSSHQIFAVVGSSYISEHHSDEMHRYLPLSENREFIVGFEKLLQALRAGLSLR